MIEPPRQVLENAFGRALSLNERLDTVTTSAQEMVRPTVYGQGIIILAYVPLLTFTGVEGKTFMPMAMTVIIALASAFVLSLTFVPAAIAIAVTGPVQEKENALVRGLKTIYRPALQQVIRSPLPVIICAALLFAGAALLFMQLGQEFTPTLDEKNIVMEVKRIPSTSLTQSQTMQLANEKMAGRFPQVAFVFSRTGTPDLAADPMPPSASDKVTGLPVLEIKIDKSEIARRGLSLSDVQDVIGIAIGGRTAGPLSAFRRDRTQQAA